METDVRPQRFRVVQSESYDPYLNLAIEQQLFSQLLSGDVVLFLWQNDPCVVIGRHQNPWKECDLDGMAHDGVKLARRASGGGAVYHDRGNGNFTFLADASLYRQELQFAVVVAALAGFGIIAERSGRNDILVGGRKISGNAFRYQKDRSYHHGTLLMDADLDRLTRFLNPGRNAVTKSSGIESVRSQVVNVRELSRDITWNAVAEAIVQRAQAAYAVPAERTTVDERTLSGDDDLARRRRSYRDWRWIYGRTPDFTRRHRFTGPDPAVAEFELNVHRGVIVEPAPRALLGLRYRPEDLAAVANNIGDQADRERAQQLAEQLSACAGLPISQEEIE